MFIFALTLKHRQMKTALNNKIEKIIDNGNYIKSHYYETLDMTQKRMSDTDYSYYITTADNMLHFYTKTKDYKLKVSEFKWRILWDKLGNVPVNDDDEIEENFEQFTTGEDKTEIWQWFEWFFDISLGKELFE
jgi:hypothetical protein